MIIAYYKNNTWKCNNDLWQYDYGQVLRIQGLSLPDYVEIQFSLTETGGETVTRIGITSDDITDVTIPDSMLENDDAAESYYIYVFIYVTDDTSGETVEEIKLYVRARSKPEASTAADSSGTYDELVTLLNDIGVSAAESATLAESWAVGGTESRDGEDTNNAKYYAEQAAASADTAGDAAEEIKAATEAAAEQEASLKETTEDAALQETSLKGATADAATQETSLKSATADADTANTALAETTEKASTENTTLTETIEKAATQETSLQKVTEAAASQESSLEETTTSAGTANSTLTETISNAGTVHETLTETISSAGTAHATLTETISSAGTANNTLEGTIETAGETNTELKNSTSTATELKDALDAAVEAVATEETAEAILALLGVFEPYLQTMAESAGKAGSLNGYALERGESGEVILTYTDPDTEETEDPVTLPTGTTQSDILSILSAITDNVAAIAGTDSTETDSSETESEEG